MVLGTLAITIPPTAASGSAVRGADCNGFGAGATPGTPANYGCTEIRRNSADERVEINGHYVGHDEPLIAYYSDKRGSGNDLQVRMKLPVEPPKPPTGSLSGPTSTFMLYPAFWFSMVLCDNESFPEGTKTCTPNSDSNIQVPFTATHAGTAFLETQFYPPGWSPFVTQFSCDQVHWCASLHINSLQGDFNFNVNPNCVEPTAFAFIQRDGHPTGPAGPDNFTNASFTPNGQTLLMNGGDELRITIRDTAHGLLNRIDDLTTGQTGFMVASADNGFRHILWDPARVACNGAPYDYHPMYATSRAPQGIEPVTWAGWTAHTVNVSASLEIGHFESPDAASDPNGEELPCFPGPTIPGCIGTDVDFDGFSYQTAYPDGSRNRPSPLLWKSPRSRGGDDRRDGRDDDGGYNNTYSQVNFETDLPAIEATCNVFTGVGCSNPPPGAAFYPFPHTMRSEGGCRWTIGANHPRQISDFGGNSTAAWGPLETTDFGGGFVASLNYATGPFRNPCP
ncbi:MAG: hypothetical protein AUI14_11480 [Actinobacteria bacterium 13_2_20CM_2_71_6]|nr:MAG: hypothetical protein AUI14_11480 [Actinobacteria bacterium 13_2_20CM_2_71_6]